MSGYICLPFFEIMSELLREEEKRGSFEKSFGDDVSVIIFAARLKKIAVVL